MKNLKSLFLVMATLIMSISCSSQTKNGSNPITKSKNDKVQLIYFHYTHRCATCQAVEAVSKEAIAELYGPKVTFTSYNLDEEAGQTKGKALDVSGQTLLIISGNTSINMTNEGFMNARSNPDKLKAIIKEKIDPLL